MPFAVDQIRTLRFNVADVVRCRPDSNATLAMPPSMCVRSLCRRTTFVCVRRHSTRTSIDQMCLNNHIPGKTDASVTAPLAWRFPTFNLRYLHTIAHDCTALHVNVGSLFSWFSFSCAEREKNENCAMHSTMAIGWLANAATSHAASSVFLLLCLCANGRKQSGLRQYILCTPHVCVCVCCTCNRNCNRNHHNHNRAIAPSPTPTRNVHTETQKLSNKSCAVVSFPFSQHQESLQHWLAGGGSGEGDLFRLLAFDFFTRARRRCDYLSEDSRGQV